MHALRGYRIILPIVLHCRSHRHKRIPRVEINIGHLSHRPIKAGMKCNAKNQKNIDYVKPHVLDPLSKSNFRVLKGTI